MACLSVQFLLQDAVRARLGKEAFDFEDGRSTGGSAPYSMGAAQRLTADFRRLGSAPDGLPHLDHLRHLITGLVADILESSFRMPEVSQSSRQTCLTWLEFAVCLAYNRRFLT